MDKWSCLKCGNTDYEEDQIQTTGGNLSKLYDVQNKKFIAITCKNCGYTEFYKEKSSLGMNIIDFLFRRN